MHRDMSYRKPVPIYVPSPPLSPQELPESFDPHNQCQKDVSLEASLGKIRQQTIGIIYPSDSELPPPPPPKVPEEFDSWNIIEKEIPPLPGNWVKISVAKKDFEEHSPPSGPAPLLQEDAHEYLPSKPLEKEIPPLPSNWREVLAERTSEDTPVPLENEEAVTKRSDLQHQAPISSGVVPKRQRNPSIRGHGYDGSYATLPGTQSSRGRGLPRDYRPPTPPLRFKSQRPEIYSLRVNTESKISHMEAPTTRGMLYHHSNPSSHYYNHTRSGGSITAAHSFRTEKTAVSTNPSTVGWSREKATPSDQATYNNYKALVPQRKVVAVDIVVHDHMISAHGKSPRKSGLKQWAKKVWKSMNLCQ